MKRLSFLCFFALFCLVANAQFYQVAEGPVFSDTLAGFSKILQMKNYSTIYLHINFEQGLNVQVYEPKYRNKTETNIEPAYGKLKAGNLEGIFEANGDAVVMISSTVDNSIALYRLIIDGTTGKLKEEKQIASLNIYSVKKSDKDFAKPGIHVRKDPDSENYAVVVTNSFVSDTTKRIEVILYGSDNNEIKRSYYSSSTEKYKYLQFVDMAVLGKDKVVVLLYGYNLKEKNEKEGELIYVDLDKTTKNLGFIELNFSNDLVVDAGITRYDPKTQRLLLLITAKVKSESGKLHSYLGFINPANRMLESNNVLPGKLLQNKYEDVFGKDAEFTGIPQNLFVNPDRTYTIIFEDMESKKKDSTGHTLLKNITIASFDNEPELKSSYFVPMNHYVTDVALPAFYQSDREFTGQEFLKYNQYKSNVYITDGHKSYLVFNDTQNNALVSAGDKVAQFSDIKTADAFFCSIEGKMSIPKRQYVFGKPVDNNDHKTGVFTVYDYDKANAVLVTLKSERAGEHPGVKLVWLQP